LGGMQEMEGEAGRVGKKHMEGCWEGMERGKSG